ncbi:transglutaminase domain-containing protein [Pedobacter sp. MW01-1-1]|uniref:transglutaminase domain-containing protein n=1 Tax=Pedobacter sp. MW01-1-1 TaxID=3383027 RepID=UPI003FF14ACB
MNRYFFCFVLFLCSMNAFSQQFDYGKIGTDEYFFDKKKLDSAANAVVLREFGATRLMFNENNGGMEVLFEYHTRIKIYNKEGFEQANIEIPLWRNGNNAEDIAELKASTINYQDGSFTVTVMDNKAVFNEVKSQYLTLKKFTLPNIKDGSVIEYAYTLRSPNVFNFKTWEFQSDIPKIQSDYLVYIPGIYNYNVSLRGFLKLTDSKAEIAKECERINGVSIDCSKILYSMKDIPAFYEEEYMTAPSNFKSAICFELSDVQDLRGVKTSYTKTWKDVEYELLNDKDFGGQMKRKDLFKDIIPLITKADTSDLDKAKSIYNYIKKQIKWNDYYGKYAENGIKTALEKRSGNVADINLSLIAALSAANLDAEAVILSTRDNGMPNPLYPVLSNFNYMIAKVNVGNTSYLLDATEPLLPFGLLPLRCVNDKGRIINLKKPSDWIPMKSGLPNNTRYVLTGDLNKEGKIVGTMMIYSSGYSALNKRKEMKRSSSVEEFVEKMDERMTKIKILNHTVNNLDSVENTLIEKYDVEMNVSDGLKDQFYFNPFIINAITKNPFNLNERTYPVDLGATSDEKIVVYISLPEQYTLVEQPKNMALSIGNGTVKYSLKSQFEENRLGMNQVLQFNQAIYSADDYFALKELYSKIIQNQKTELLFKTTTK